MEKKSCRICFCDQQIDLFGYEQDRYQNISDPLIKPCGCKNSYVHRGCLDKWRCESMNPNSLLSCEVCLTPYQYEIVQDNKKKYYALLKFTFLILRDIFLAALPAIFAVVITGFIINSLKEKIVVTDITYKYIILVSMAIIIIGTLIFMLFALYLILCYTIAFIRIYFGANINMATYKPYLLYLITYNTKQNNYHKESVDCCDAFCLSSTHNDCCCICVYGGDSCNCDCDDGCAVILVFVLVIVALFCLLIIAVIFIMLLFKIITLHSRNLHKKSYYKVYRIKDLNISINEV